MSDQLRALKDQAAQLTAKGKWSGALEAWQKVVAAAPTDVAAEQKVAEVLVKLGRPDEAVAAYERVAKRYGEQGQFFKASAVCRLIVGIEPTHVRTQELLAELYARSKAQSKSGSVNAPPSLVSAPVKASEPEIDVEVLVEPPAPTKSGLPSIPLFSTLSTDELKAVLAEAMEVRAFSAGEAIVTEGQPGESMFALVEGKGGIYRHFGRPEQRRVDELQPGDIFGEAAMVSGAPRLATVIAETDAVALELNRAAMQAVVRRHPEVGQHLETFYRRRLLANALRASPLLRALPHEAQQALARKFRAARYQPGQTVLAEGAPAAAVQLLLRGTCSASHGSGQKYPDLHEGDLFGEVSVMTDGPATATVTASSEVLTLQLSAADFKECVLAEPGAHQAVKALVETRLERTARFNAGVGSSFELDVASTDGRV